MIVLGIMKRRRDFYTDIMAQKCHNVKPKKKTTYMYYKLPL